MKPWTGEAAVLADRIAAFVRGSLSNTAMESFDTLAMDLHRWQVSKDPVARGLMEGAVERWQDIPAMPVGLYKELRVGTLAHDAPARVFHTSGTTGGGRGAHRMRSTALYDLGALAWARRCVPDLPRSVVALLEDPRTAPDSSLSHMVDLFGPATWHVQAGEVDTTSLSRCILDAGSAIFLASTSFALADALAGGCPPLPDGSVVMITGGFKGRTHRLEDRDLYRAARDQLRPARIVTEYGMTELSSQLWATPGTAYLPPPWLRCVAVDPVSGAPRPNGASGQLRFYDLCNLDACVGVETLDEGLVEPNGSVRLSGRLADAPARGCSLTVEEAWARRA